jgi:type II secretory pathway predicted ATPase ExeA
VRHYQHFGLEGPLFRVTSPSQPLYMGRAHQEALAALEWGVCHEPSGFTLLIGEPGTGKTTLLLSLLTRSHYQIRTATVSNPGLRFDEMLCEIARQLGIGQAGSKLAMLDAFDGFLGALEPGGRVVIIIDEAQGLSDTALEEMRLFSNRGAVEEKQLHFILIAQPELARRLLEPGLRQLNDRIGGRAVLDRMSRAEALGYIEYWMQAGGGRTRRVFGRRALACIIDHGLGVPRRLNVLCHNAMLQAYATGRRKVDLAAASKAAAEYENLFASSTNAPPARKIYWLRFPRQRPTVTAERSQPAAGVPMDSSGSSDPMPTRI